MTQEVNLYSFIPQPPKEILTPKVMFSITGGLILILALFFGISQFRFFSHEKQLNVLKFQQETLAQKIVALGDEDTTSAEQHGLKKEVADLAKRIEAKQQLIEVLRTEGFVNTSGFSAYLRTLAQQVLPNVWLTNIVISSGGEDVHLEGSAIQSVYVLELLERLSQSDMFQGQDFKGFRIARPTEKNKKYIDFIMSTNADGS